MYILGISCFYHDSAAVLLKDGVLIAASEEERFSRKKHDSSFPKNAVNFCLRKEGISTNDLLYIVFYEKPFLKFERIFLNTISNSPKSLKFFKESMKEWFFDKLWIKSNIAAELNIKSNKILFCEHHLSHMASSFLCSPFKKAALLSIDGVGEWTTTSWGVGVENKIDIKEEIRFPNSIGMLYSAFTVLAGFEPNEGEYKLMGLAPYGKPRFVDEVKKVISYKDDGSFLLDQNYFSYQYDLKGVYTEKFERIFGSKNLNPDKVTAHYADIAASIQLVTEDILIKVAKYVRRKTNLDYLCYAGGVALNSKANWEIAIKSGFKELFIQPAAGDSGGALGAALWVHNSVLGKRRTFVMPHSYYGDSENKEQIKKSLDEKGLKYSIFKNEDVLIDKITDQMEKGKVIGWIQQESEWGPRSLGHRSIIADPRSRVMKDKVNSKIKFREAFRPFAPSALLESAEKYFSVQDKKKHSPFKFMLYVVPVKKGRQDNLGAITHEDGTARPQFVNKEINPLYHSLIKSFGQKTGVEVILNTSFNLKGEPIVNTTKEAIKTFMKSGIDTLVVDNFVVEKNK